MDSATANTAAAMTILKEIIIIVIFAADPQAVLKIDYQRGLPRTQVKPWALALLVCLYLGLAGCNGPESRIEIGFELDAPTGESCHVQTLSFYVSDPHLIDTDGVATAIRLHASSPWQSDRTVLIALSESCQALTGSTQLNTQLRGMAPSADYRAFEFSFGVPFELNHRNPLAAAPPLDVSAMFWVWQTGYKFLRYDVPGEWSFHLGSTGCHSVSAVRAPAEPCTRPNLARIRLPLSDVRQGRVVVDMDAWLAGLLIEGADNCLEAYASDPLCRALVERIGLDVESGRCREQCAAQVLFRSSEVPG